MTAPNNQQMKSALTDLRSSLADVQSSICMALSMVDDMLDDQAPTTNSKSGAPANKGTVEAQRRYGGSANA